MKSAFKKILSCAVLAALILAAVSQLGRLTERKYGKEKDSVFLEEKNPFDVLFLGSSRTLNDIYPLDLWNEYGIVSYNLGCHNATIPVSYWILKNALLYTHPKLVVLDAYLLSNGAKVAGSGLAHEALDGFPLSLTKLEGVLDLFTDTAAGEKGKSKGLRFKDILSFIWDFSLYHDRWADIGAGDICLNYNREKGAERRNGNGILTMDLGETDDLAYFEENSAGTEYISRLIADCRANGTEVLLIYLPSVRTDYTRAEAGRMKKIAEDAGVNCIDFLNMDLVNNIDFGDTMHLNFYGARKITRYLGNYISEHYDISDHRGDEAYYDWYDDYDRYVQDEANELPYIQTLPVYMETLSAGNYDVILEVNDPAMWKNKLFRRLAAQMGVDLDSVTENTDLIALSDGGWDETVYDYFTEQQMLGSEPFETVLGDLEKEWTKDEIVLKLNGKTLYQIGRTSASSACQVRLTVMDRTTRELLDRVSFNIETAYDENSINTLQPYRGKH